MLNSLFFILLNLCFISSQNDSLTHKIVRYYKDGSPRVEYCYKPDSEEMVKEICFFKNGNYDYIGEYKDHIEHGTWTFYWENGNIRAQEYYINGKENGTMYDYNEQGIAIIEYVYNMGKLVSKKELFPPQN